MASDAAPIAADELVDVVVHVAVAHAAPVASPAHLHAMRVRVCVRACWSIPVWLCHQINAGLPAPSTMLLALNKKNIAPQAELACSESHNPST
eukprot:1158032-Pelagomonas_calceolata.AAC.9